MFLLRGRISINIDAACNNNGKFAIAIVAGNEEGRVLRLLANRIDPVTTNKIAEPEATDWVIYKFGRGIRMDI